MLITIMQTYNYGWWFSNPSHRIAQTMCCQRCGPSTTLEITDKFTQLETPRMRNLYLADDVYLPEIKKRPWKSWTWSAMYLRLKVNKSKNIQRKDSSKRKWLEKNGRLWNKYNECNIPQLLGIQGAGTLELVVWTWESCWNSLSLYSMINKMGMILPIWRVYGKWN